MRKFVLGLVLVATVTACSSPPDQADQVASLTTPGSGSPSSPATPADSQRPRMRIDMTPEDKDALYQVHIRCMAEHGVDKTRFQTEGIPTDEVQKAAAKACESSDPLPPWEMDRANPETPDFTRRVVQCLRDKGVREVEVANDPNSPIVSVSLGGPENDRESVVKGLELMPECEKEASKK
ncbi:lipoprotein [Actinosynnema sp. CS-041913]|uniref:lipoprotein n=1 Tax=Actinosynnema sp. CS-041913 TaxID=3239917 RepID=UPI003D90A00D